MTVLSVGVQSPLFGKRGAEMPEDNRSLGASALLQGWGRGDLHARDELVPLVYAELRRRAAAYLRRERADHTLQPTALVHEAFLRLMGQERVAWQNRAHFFGLAAQMMRRILVDHARKHDAAKRPPREWRVTVAEQHAIAPAPDCDVMLLDHALTELGALDPRQAQIVELRYFAGLSEHEVAKVLKMSRSTVTREWRIARLWLFRRIRPGASEGRR